MSEQVKQEWNIKQQAKEKLEQEKEKFCRSGYWLSSETL